MQMSFTILFDTQFGFRLFGTKKSKIDLRWILDLWKNGGIMHVGPLYLYILYITANEYSGRCCTLLFTNHFFISLAGLSRPILYVLI